MTNNEIKQRLDTVCQALDHIQICEGIKNSNNLSASFGILQEIIQALPDDEKQDTELSEG